MDHTDLVSPAENKVTLVDPHILSRELRDVQVRPRCGTVSERLAIAAGVFALVLDAEGNLTVSVFQLNFPNDIYCLIPCFVAARQVDSPPQVEV